MGKTLIGPPEKASQDFFVFSCFRYPRYQRIIGHMPNTMEIFHMQLRLYGPVMYIPERAWATKAGVEVPVVCN